MWVLLPREVEVQVFMSLPLKRKSAACFCVFPKVLSAGSLHGCTPVYLNVYDVTPMNGYVSWAGFGIFHSGVEVYGVEYAFGAHDYPTNGIFEVDPRECPGYMFRKSIFIGTTCLDPLQIRQFITLLSENYYGDAYHLIAKNCNHFSKDLCFRLTGNVIPKWVNRLARIGAFCRCLLPEHLEVCIADHGSDHPPDVEDEEKKSLRRTLSFLSSISHPKVNLQHISS